VTLYLPLAVLALADAISDIEMIKTRHAIRSLPFHPDETMLRDAVRELRPAPPLRNATRDELEAYDEAVEEEALEVAESEPMLTETEFLIDQLVAQKLVDEAAVAAIRRQFRHLTRNVQPSDDGRRTLTAEVAFEEIRGRVARGAPVSAGANCVDVDDSCSPPTFRWSSVEEWCSKSWSVRVQAKAEDDKLRSEEEHELKKRKQGTRQLFGSGIFGASDDQSRRGGA
jgi:hypothetical protein